MTPLHGAASNGHEGVVRLLLETKAAVDTASNVSGSELAVAEEESGRPCWIQLYAAFVEWCGGWKWLAGGGLQSSENDAGYIAS